MIAIYIVHDAIFYGSGFQTYTIMSYEFEILYFLLIIALSCFLKSWRKPQPSDSVHVHNFGKVIIILTEIHTATSLAIVCVYWLLLKTPQTTTAAVATNDTVHGLNFPIMWIDVFLNRTPVNATHSSYLLLSLLLFVFWAWTYHAAYNMWIYFFIDYFSKAASIFYFGLLIGFFVVYYIAFGFITLRKFLGQRYGKYSKLLDGENAHIDDTNGIELEKKDQT